MTVEPGHTHTNNQTKDNVRSSIGVLCFPKVTIIANCDQNGKGTEQIMFGATGKKDKAKGSNHLQGLIFCWRSWWALFFFYFFLHIYGPFLSHWSRQSLYQLYQFVSVCSYLYQCVLVDEFVLDDHFVLVCTSFQKFVTFCNTVKLCTSLIWVVPIFAGLYQFLDQAISH